MTIPVQYNGTRQLMRVYGPSIHYRGRHCYPAVLIDSTYRRGQAGYVPVAEVERLILANQASGKHIYQVAA